MILSNSEIPKAKCCKACGNNKKLVIHHLTYGEGQQTVTLCEFCHNFIHKFVKGKDPDNKQFTLSFIHSGRFWLQKLQKS